MFSSAGTGKGYLFAYSKGTTQSLIATSYLNSEIATYFNRVVLLAPCTYMSDGLDKATLPFSRIPGIYEPVNNLGIQKIGGSSWSDDKLKICKELS